MLGHTYLAKSLHIDKQNPHRMLQHPTSFAQPQGPTSPVTLSHTHPPFQPPFLQQRAGAHQGPPGGWFQETTQWTPELQLPHWGQAPSRSPEWKQTLSSKGPTKTQLHSAGSGWPWGPRYQQTVEYLCTYTHKSAIVSHSQIFREGFSSQVQIPYTIRNARSSEN